MGVTAVGRNNAGLNTWEWKFATSVVVELINRFHLVVVQQKRLIPLIIDLNMRLILSVNNFECKSAAPAIWGQQ